MLQLREFSEVQSTMTDIHHTLHVDEATDNQKGRIAAAHGRFNCIH